MSSLSQFLASTSPKAITAAGPGSNGYWRREMWLRAGTFSFTVKKSGKIKIYAGGAAGGGGRKYPGSSAGLSCDERDYVAGDVITVTIGAGGIGTAWNVDGGNGGTTSVVCAARGLNLVLTGAIGGRENGTGMTAGTATGGNVFNRNGASAAGSGVNRGGASSASPFGNGFASAGQGGAGWGGAAKGESGASSHRAIIGRDGAQGLLSKGGVSWHSSNQYQRSDNGESQPWWDLTDFDGGGGASWANSDGPVGNGGVGSGGGCNNSGGSGSGGIGGIGGGGGSAGSVRGGDGGNCAGGGAASSESGMTGGNGGDGLCIIYWDEVQL